MSENPVVALQINRSGLEFRLECSESCFYLPALFVNLEDFLGWGIKIGADRIEAEMFYLIIIMLVK